MSESGKSRRILAIHAHPDDLEIQCAGTLAQLKEKGAHIQMITMTAGDCGSAELAPEHIARIRRQEAQDSADLLGVSYDCLEFKDLQIVQDNPGRQKVTEALRKFRPEIVITAPLHDYMSDHEMTSRLVRDACFNAPIPNYQTDAEHPAPPLDHIPHLYFVDPVEGTDYYGQPVNPDFIIDISRQYELKEKMLACHKSQRDWLREQHGIDEYLDSTRRWSKHRGEAIGAEYGEGFVQYKGHPYPQDNLLLELLS